MAQFGIDVVIIEPGAIKTEFGDVMIGPMLERSGNGPYATLAKKLAKANEEFESNRSSPPSVIAEVVSDAVRSNKPKTRYAAGTMAKPLLLMRHWLPDRWFDNLVLRMVS